MNARSWRKCAEGCGLAALIGIGCVAIGAKDDSVRLRKEANQIAEHMAETNTISLDMRKKYKDAQQKLVTYTPSSSASTYRAVGAMFLLGGTLGALYCGLRSARDSLGYK